MRSFVALLALVVVATASPVFELEPLSDAHIFYINNVVNATWKAGHNFLPQELGRVKRMLGVDIEANRAMNRIYLKKRHIEVNTDLPTNFDPRQKWPHCPTLGDIRDQAACGSCWAFGSVEAMSDRICIGGGGNVNLSAEDVLSCCEDCGDGCEGGYPMAAYGYYLEKGVVTGGQYGSKQGCYPYAIPHCDHHTTGKYKPCGPIVPTPPCKKSCRSGYAKSWSQDKHFGKSKYQVSGVQQIMTELYNNGPVTAAFTVYADFPQYKSGVYEHKTGAALGGHAVKIMGWGVENNVDYWLVANSWNSDWGDKGYFKIRRGTDECGIEDEIVAGEPKL